MVLSRGGVVGCEANREPSVRSRLGIVGRLALFRTPFSRDTHYGCLGRTAKAAARVCLADKDGPAHLEPAPSSCCQLRCMEPYRTVLCALHRPSHLLLCCVAALRRRLGSPSRAVPPPLFFFKPQGDIGWTLPGSSLPGLSVSLICRTLASLSRLPGTQIVVILELNLEPIKSYCAMRLIASRGS